ncbi:MAG: restriction endonuclease subunit S [Planctomycetia bacterium]|nr:restriction endonuclease subunit S [Planctomycetia bacterium]
MKNLSEVEWGVFFIENIFKIAPGKRLTKSGMKQGKRPFIGASDSNNGITGFVSNENVSVDSNILGVNYNGSVVENFYHPYSCLFSDDVKRFRFKKIKGNKYLYLFVKQIILMQKKKYTYGYKFNEKRMERQKILLPITTTGQPDYAFMESYMREIERSLIEKYRTYLAQFMPQMSSWGGVKSLGEKKWDEFEIGKLFVLIPGKSKGLNHLRKSNEGISYLGATNQNNGVLCQVNKVRKYVQKGNCIAFIRNGEGSMGLSVYKWEDFIATSDISIGYNSKLNRYVGMFITTIADRVRGKYNFGYKRSGSRLAKERLMLPIDETGQPDYAYMESYMRQQEYRCISRYLDLLKSRNVK